MNTTDIETRCGLILENAVAEALRRAGISFSHGVKYDPDCETPDFLIPDAKHPAYIVECHQTSDRESLKMKILRLLSAVFEAKAFYGKDVISVNLLFGNADILPANNLDTFCCFFDANLFPRSDGKYASCAKKLEDLAREYAGNANYDTTDAADALCAALPAELDKLSRYLKASLKAISAPNAELFPVWEKEARRVGALGGHPRVGSRTEYKPTVLASLLLSDEAFTELLERKDPNKCGDAAKRQFVLAGIVRRRGSAGKKYAHTERLELTSEFDRFIRDPYAMSLRTLCKEQLGKDDRLGCFFEDVRDEARRAAICEAFVGLARLPRDEFRSSLLECLLHGSCYGVRHGRCWIADLMPLAVGESHNSFNRRMVSSPNYRQSLGNPYSNIAIRSPRLGADDDALRNYADVAADCFFDAADEKGIDLSALSPDALAKRLLAFRLGGLIKLQKLNPLYIAVEHIAGSLRLTARYRGVKSVISDLSTGKFDVFEVTDGKTRVLINALYVAPTYGSDHKADEWSARRRAIGYRLKKGVIVEQTRYSEYIFVVDGTWTDKSIRKLHKAGWNHVCRLRQLEDILRDIFDRPAAEREDD